MGNNRDPGSVRWSRSGLTTGIELVRSETERLVGIDDIGKDIRRDIIPSEETDMACKEC